MIRLLASPDPGVLGAFGRLHHTNRHEGPIIHNFNFEGDLIVLINLAELLGELRTQADRHVAVGSAQIIGDDRNEGSDLAGRPAAPPAVDRAGQHEAGLGGRSERSRQQGQNRHNGAQSDQRAWGGHGWNFLASSAASRGWSYASLHAAGPSECTEPSL